MPELPEVETTRRGIRPALRGHTITRVTIRQRQLRWPVPGNLAALLTGQQILEVSRRAKYLLIETTNGKLILHLGMSGSLRVIPADTPPGKHDHIDLCLEHGQCLRFHDPRRFGAMLWTREEASDHPLLRTLGPEPLDKGFNGNYLYQVSRGRKRRIRDFLLDGHVVAGIGNIYANEALFTAGIHPMRAAGRIGRERYHRLAEAIDQTLRAAIQAGGTSLKDFRRADGRPGYFRQQLKVYGRAGKACPRCGTNIRTQQAGNRSLFYCPRCQK